jgi:hypothetical protein
VRGQKLEHVLTEAQSPHAHHLSHGTRVPTGQSLPQQCGHAAHPAMRGLCLVRGHPRGPRAGGLLEALAPVSHEATACGKACHAAWSAYPFRSISHNLSRVKSDRGVASLLAVAGRIPCKDASLFAVCSCPWRPSSPFDTLRAIERCGRGHLRPASGWSYARLHDRPRARLTSAWRWAAAPASSRATR